MFNNKTVCFPHLAHMDQYKDLPFSSKTPQGDFYTFSTVKDIVKKGNIDRENIFRCRTIGILENINGKYLLSDMTNQTSEKEYLLISVCFLKTKLLSTVMPYCVQIFGAVEWKSQPVLYARNIKVLSTKVALLAHQTMVQTVANHLVSPVCHTNSNETEICDAVT